MYKIATLNKISSAGLTRFTDDYVFTDDLNSADGILVRSHDMHSMDFSPNLLAIARAGAGVNNIPIERCTEKGIVVFNTPGANANAVKELVIAAMFMAARNLPEAIEWSRRLTSDVAKAVEKGKSQFGGTELRGKCLGIIGLGAIGVLVANTAERLGMRVIGYDPFMTVDAAHRLSNKIPVVNDMGDLLSQCDYASIHVPAMDSTKGMINRRRFSQMKNGICFLNFARDNLVDNDDLFAAIESGVVSKYITDFPTEAVIGKKGIICIPHLGASTEEAEDNCASMAAHHLMDYIENGNIINSVNYPSCNMGPAKKSASPRICILNINQPAMLTKITGTFADIQVNISNMLNMSKGNFTYTMIDADADVDVEYIMQKLNFDGIISVRIIK